MDFVSSSPLFYTTTFFKISFVSVEKLWTQNARIIHDVWSLLILSNDEKRMIYENFEKKKRGSREKRGLRKRNPCPMRLWLHHGRENDHVTYHSWKSFIADEIPWWQVMRINISSMNKANTQKVSQWRTTHHCMNFAKEKVDNYI